MITPLFAFLFIQSEIVREKEFKLRQGTFPYIQDSIFLGQVMELIGFHGFLLLSFTLLLHLFLLILLASFSDLASLRIHLLYTSYLGLCSRLL